MFSEELAKYDWEETTRQIQHKRPADVETALGKEHLTLDDFMALISPAAAAYLEPMARLSRRYTQERFGKTISMYIPMYITNSCTNSCIYCGFNHHNKFDRVILTMEQIEDECKAIRALGPFENLLLVTGENPRAAGVDYIEQALKVCRPYFNNLTIEVMPLASEDYYRLTQSGLNGVVCFQETYNRANYNIYHPAGMKSKFEWRVNGFDLGRCAFVADGELFEGLGIGMVAARIGFRSGAHRCRSERGDVVAERGFFTGREGDVHVVIEDAEGESELGQLPVGHHHIRLKMPFRRTHAREIDAVARFPVVLAQVLQMQGHHRHVCAPLFEADQRKCILPISLPKQQSGGE